MPALRLRHRRGQPSPASAVHRDRLAAGRSVHLLVLAIHPCVHACKSAAVPDCVVCVHACAYACVHVHARVRACMHVCMYAHARVSVYLRVRAPVSACVYVCAHSHGFLGIHAGERAHASTCMHTCRPVGWNVVASMPRPCGDRCRRCRQRRAPTPTPCVHACVLHVCMRARVSE